MLNVGAKSILILFIIVIFSTCIDPYYPELTGYQSLLVVEGLVTNEKSSYIVNLSRTIEGEDKTSVKVSDATVFVTDDTGNKIYFQNKGGGRYKTDSTQFIGTIGRTYSLHIITMEGGEYISDPCIMESVGEIESIYFLKDQELVDNGTDVAEGITIFLDSDGEDNTKYYRWGYEETWKFKVPSPKKYDYVNDRTIDPVKTVREYCWKSRLSDEVLIRSVYSGESGRIEKEPMVFLASEESDRLLVQYSILVRQYSISKKEYDFWDNMKRINESAGDIFATQPFPVISNIRNIEDPNEQVLGYFQVSAVSQKREDITFSDIADLGLPFYRNPCQRIEMAPEDYPRSPYSPPLTWDELYEMYCVTSDYYFVEPRYKGTSGQLDKMVFARPECADCELTGTISKPDFWIDLD